MNSTDIEFAKLLMARNMLPKADVQKYLNAVENLQGEGKNVTLENFLCEQKILSAEELMHLKESKKRGFHCGKCNAQYHARDEDIGIRFKCKKCGTIVTVSPTGKTAERKEERKSFSRETSSCFAQNEVATILKDNPGTTEISLCKLPLDFLLALESEAPLQDEMEWWSGEEESESELPEFEEAENIDYLSEEEESMLMEWAGEPGAKERETGSEEES